VLIILPAGGSSCRRPRLTSNVRPRNKLPVQIVALRIQVQQFAHVVRFVSIAKTMGTAQALVSCGTRGIFTVRVTAADLAEPTLTRHARRSFAGEEKSFPAGMAQVIAVGARRWCSLHSQARRVAPRRAAVGCSTSRLKRLVLLRSSRSGEVNSRPTLRSHSRPRSGQHPRTRIRCFSQARLHRPHPRPNTSVEARPNGKATRPPPGVVYHPSSGRVALPSAPPHLER
jgi:hypothetical protein